MASFSSCHYGKEILALCCGILYSTNMDCTRVKLQSAQEVYNTVYTSAFCCINTCTEVHVGVI